MKAKLIFFDMEGTLFRKTYKDSYGNTAPSAWTLLAEHLGPKALKFEEETKRRWTEGKYTGYVEWMEETILIYKNLKLTKSFFEGVMRKIEYHKGVLETFEELRKRGIKTALISGGFKAQADRAVVDLKINHSFAACELFWDPEGYLLHWNLLPCDYEGKLDFMSLIMKEHGLKREECAFVGDGRNDVQLAKSVGLSIAFNAAVELQKITTHAINQEEDKENFLEVLHFLC